MGVLNGRKCLVTGGGTGIGRATAGRLIEEGAEVWIAGRRATDLELAAANLGSSCHAVQCDVTDVSALEDIVKRAGGFDVAVANAAVSFPVKALDDPIARWRELMEVNCWGAVNTCRSVAPGMMSRGGGRIVLVSSILGHLAEIGSTPYGMAKAALDQMCRQLAVEWAPYNILVNVVAPGCVHTPMSYVNGSSEYDDEWFKTFFIHKERPRIPLMRPGTPDEIAEAILFFCLPRNSYCTGAVLTVDGGLSVKF
jgi:3-oxoacyl-[acyl-carrier protein] reductase